MKLARSLCVLSLAIAVAACGGDDDGPSGPVDMYDAVDPFIGTGGLAFGVGSAYPGPALPFAMIHAGPDTRSSFGAPGFSHCAGYWWEDTHIEAFSLLRMHGTGVPDYGVVGIMPVDGMTADKRDEPGYAAAFSHDDEEASPGYYRVALGSGIEVEITTTLRAALFRFTFPDSADPVVLMDLEHTIGDGVNAGADIALDLAAGSIASRVLFQGDMSSRFGGFDVFTRAEVSPAPSEIGVWDESGLRNGDATASGVDVGGWMRFPDGTTEVVMRVGVSFVDADGAAGNLAAEIADFDFDSVRAAAEQTWRDELAILEIEGAEGDDKTIIATALYHSLLMPTLMSDADGRMVDSTGQLATTTTRRYSDFSLWDTYRTLHPWLLLAEDDHNADIAASLFGYGTESGAYPQWSLAHSDVHVMIGSPADMVMAESAVKGIPMDESAAYAFSRVTAFGPAPGSIGGRSGIDDYIAYGYVPDDMHGGSVAMTLEFAIADYTLAEWARRIGEDADADALEQRADNAWQSLLEPETMFFRPRNADGSWAQWTGPLAQDGPYTEGDAWQYLWLVPNNLDGLAEALGGTAARVLRELGDRDRRRRPAPVVLARQRARYPRAVDLRRVG
jgi:predicted alpha-1,2-mannosidase